MSYRLQGYEILILATSLMLFLEVPPIIYGYLTYRQFEYLSLSGYMPHEELMMALRSGGLSDILGAPLISLNMTSGHIFSNVYVFTIGALAASLILGILIGLSIIAKLRMQSIDGTAGSGKGFAVAGLGMVVTIGASSAGLLGCHGGSGMSGGILALTGLGETTAARLAQLSPYIQLAIIIALFCYCMHLHQRLKQASALNS